MSTPGLASPLALRRPCSSCTRDGPELPSRGSLPMDLVTTAPAPWEATLSRDSPLSPKTPEANIVGFLSLSFPTEVERSAIVSTNEAAA